MKTPRLLWILLAIALLGALIGYLISTKRPLFFQKEQPFEVAEKAPRTSEVVFDFPELEVGPPTVPDMEFPEGAIGGELVVHFDNRADYLAYLKAMVAAGEEPLGQIDELMAVRIPESALLKTNLGKYGARASYSYRVERPLPPVEIDPEALASLRAFGIPAREISGGSVGGDGEGIIVGILDSGIEAHSLFDDVYIVRKDLAGGGTAVLGASHGTSVASIITGRDGIAPDAELFVVRVLDDDGLGNSYHVAEGIVQAVDMGVKVINMSLGVYQDATLLRQAVQYAHEHGVVMVAAAGNDAYTSLPYPAAYSEVLAVTAVDAIGQQALFPNQSIEIDFAAPGVGILTAKEDFGSTMFSGTSAAAPFVSGTLASLMTGDNPMTPKEAVEVVKLNLNERGAPGVDPVYGRGVVDWHRIRERGTPNLVDVALADIHLQSDALPGTTMPIEVTVQNRGTKWFSNAQLEVFIGEAEPVTFTLGSLGVGQITTRKVFTQIPSLDSDEYLSIAARVLPEKLEDDIRLENNLKSVSFKLTK